MATTVFLYDPNTATDFDITSEVYSVEIDRGRNRELDEINAGTCTIRTRNQSGNFNPYFLTNVYFLLLETGDKLLLEDSGRLILEAAGSAGAYGVMTPNRRVTVKDGSTTVFTGFVEDFDYEWQPGRGHTIGSVTLVCADGLAKLARQRFLEWTTTGGQSTGARLTTATARPEVDVSWASPVSFDSGESTLQSDLVTYGSNVLNYCQLVNKAEQGRFFVGRSGALVFQDRISVAAGVAVLDFNDSASYANGQTANKIPFSGIEVTFGSELLYTKVSVDNIVGIAQTADDLTAQANYGIRHLTFSEMLLEDDGQADDMAQYLLDRYSTPEAVVSQIKVALEGLSTANRAAVAGLEISNTVTVNWTPTSGFGAVSETLVVEGVGYSKDINDATWMTFQLSAAPANDFFILDNDTDNYAGASILDNDTDNQANAGILGF